MKEGVKERLEKKKWPKKEIDRAIEIMERAEKSKSVKVRALDELVYWVVLIIAIMGTMIISVVLVPLMILLTRERLYLIIVVLGATFGFLFDTLLRDLRELNRKHYVIAGLFIPCLAIINMVFMTRFTNHLVGVLSINANYHNPITVGIAYVISFVAPAAIIRLIGRIR